jgi:ribonuclease BN (tRNA processing enzyme)
VTDDKTTVAFSSDTAETEEFWRQVNALPAISALFIETSFPNSMAELAEVSHHLTPHTMSKEVSKLNHNGLDILAVHLKPSYRDTIISEIEKLRLPKLTIMEPGRVYNW